MPDANLPLELLGLQCAIDGFTVFIEHAVGTDLARFLLRPGVEVDSHQGGNHQEHHSEAQFDGDRVQSDPEQEVHQVGDVG